MRQQSNRLCAKFVAALISASLLIAAAGAATPMVSIGYQHALALRSDGTVVSWGSDQNGQLGSGRQTFEARPGPVAGLSKVRSVSSGVNHVLAVLQDGTVWAWGSNGSGQLGDGGSLDHSLPRQVAGLANVVAVCGGSNFSMALGADGAVWAWGENSSGALGIGTQDNAATPVKLQRLSAISAIACGNNHALALRQDGTVWSWGSNIWGALGDGSTTTRLEPVEVPNLKNVIALAAGEDFSAALKQDGTVWEWGVLDPYASARPAPRVAPVQAAGLNGIRMITGSVNSFALVAIHADGQSWWNWETGRAPVLQAPVGKLTGTAAAYGETLLLKADGGVLAFGFNGNGFGNLGDGTTIYRDTPAPVVDIANIVQVAAGDWHGVALDANGNLWSWGLDSSGQLGRGRILSRAVPAAIAGLGNIVQVSAGYNHSLALDQDGNIWAWGDNGYSQLGDGSYVSNSAPRKLSSISNVQAIATGAFYSMALKRDGSVWGWGSTFPGKSIDPSIPTSVLGGAVAIAAGGGHGLALKQDGTVWAFGVNDKGQLGDGSTVDRSSPQAVAGLSEVRLIAATEASSYAVKTDGSVAAWGDNARGQLGDGTTTARLTPVAVNGLRGIVEFSAGAAHALARKNDGTVWGWSWDYEASGELGPEPAASLSTPAPVVGVAAIQQLSAGNAVSGLLRQDGLLLMGGKNFIGQLGDGTFAQHPSFVLALNPAANGFLNLIADATVSAPPDLTVPFFAIASGGIRDFRASVNTTTLFNPIDSGKSGSVFITARVPAGSFGTLPLASRDGGANPARDDPTSYVLVQLTANGWQTVSNGQLIPYASGVLGSALAAQTILDNTDTSAINGAEFCLGYGSDAAEMIASGRMKPVVSIPDPGNRNLAKVSCVVSSAPAVWPYTGLWWNQNEPGWGISLTQHDKIIFGAWYTYDESRQPAWLVIPACPVLGNGCSGEMYRVTGGTPLGVPWNGAGKVVASVGSGTLAFSGNNSATLKYSLNGVQDTKNLTRQVFASGAAAPALDYSDLWWNANESGWGVALTQQFGMIFVTIYTYDGSGKPLWYVASSCPLSGSNCSGDLYQVTGGSAPTVPWSSANTLVAKVGSLSLSFADHSNATMRYTINGVSASKTITRQAF